MCFNSKCSANDSAIEKHDVTIPNAMTTTCHHDTGKVCDTWIMSFGSAWQSTFRTDTLSLVGAKPAELPVLQSNKFDLVINLTTAKAIGLEVPWQLQQLADEVIE
jgi:hypothetical protein